MVIEPDEIKLRPEMSPVAEIVWNVVVPVNAVFGSSNTVPVAAGNVIVLAPATGTVVRST